MNFCEVLFNCVSDTGGGNCLDAICPACSAADGEILWAADGGYHENWPHFFGGLCPALPSCDLAQFECLAEQAPKVL